MPIAGAAPAIWGGLAAGTVTTVGSMAMANKANKEAKAQNQANIDAQKEAQESNYNQWFMSRYGVDPKTLTAEQKSRLPMHLPIRDQFVGPWGNVTSFAGSSSSRRLPVGFRTRAGVVVPRQGTQLQNRTASPVPAGFPDPAYEEAY
jgi:hypothetical protein